MEIADIAKVVSVSSRTATRRIEKMLQNHIIDFRIIRDMSSRNLTGYIEFILMVAVNKSVTEKSLKKCIVNCKNT